MAEEMVKALRNGEFVEIPESEARYEFPESNSFFGNAINMIPLQNAVSVARAFYGEKFQNQSLPLKNPEVPLVQNLRTKKPDGTRESFDDYLGRSMGAKFSDGDGEVTEVTPDYIEYKNSIGSKHKIDLYNNFPFNRKTRITNFPQVNVGDKIKKGQLVASSNYTDKNGTTAFGVNARIGLVPYKGWSIDDAVVVSESFAKKMASDHMYTFSQPEDKGLQISRDKFVSTFGDKYTKDQLANIDENGVVKEGTILKKDDPILLATKPRIVSSTDSQLGTLSKYIKNTKQDASLKWDGDNDGVVTSVAKGKNGWVVNVQTFENLQPGDKLAERSGNKNTLSKIIPDSEMPYTEDGQPLDILLNPLGIPSRMNASLVMEMMLGKIAKKTGKPFKISEFRDDSNWLDFVEKKLKENNLTDTEKVYDPKLQRFLDNPITVGNAYVLKIHHTGKAGLSARNQGAYDSGWQQPLKGGDEGAHAKRLSGLEATSMLSAGAYNVLNDAMTLRGQKNDEYWRAVRNGQNPEMPRKSPFSWDKYLAVLSGSGLYAKEMTNGNLRLGPYTDKILEQQKPQEITLPEIVDNEMNPVQGGLFDPMLSVGNKWGKITLDEPYPNPAFESAITSLLGITNKEFNSVLQGKENLKNYGSGPQAIHKALKSIDTKQLEQDAKETIKNGTKTKKPRAIKLLNVLEGIKRNELKPEDFMISAVPVLPPRFRPYAMVGDTFIPGDANELYKELIHVRDNVRDSKKVFDDKDLGDEKSALYNAIKAAYGFGEPVGKKLRDRKVSGFMSSLIGDTSKFSSWQRNVVSKPQDFTGSAVIDVDPDLGFDEMSMPNEMAWHLFAPYISQYMTRAGMSLEQATKEIEDRTPRAEQYLDKVMQDKVVFATRSPSWHKYNSLGFHAKRHEGKNILLNGLAETGMNGDHDGDKIMVHVPALAKAQQEVRDKLMPSKQLLSIRDKQTVVNPIKHEMVLGLYNASKGKGVDVYVDSVAEALRKIQSGEIKPEDNVHLRNVKTSAVRRIVPNYSTYSYWNPLLQSIKDYEGFRERPYPDQGIFSIGYGFNTSHKDMLDYLRRFGASKNYVTKEQADKILSAYLSEVTIPSVTNGLTKWDKLSDDRKNALINMAYQMGGDGFRNFTNLRNALNREDFVGAEEQMEDSKWGRTGLIGNRTRQLRHIMNPAISYNPKRDYSRVGFPLYGSKEHKLAKKLPIMTREDWMMGRLLSGKGYTPISDKDKAMWMEVQRQAKAGNQYYKHTPERLVAIRKAGETPASEFYGKDHSGYLSYFRDPDAPTQQAQRSTMPVETKNTTATPIKSNPTTPIASNPVTPSPVATPQYTPRQVMQMYPNANKVPQDMRQYYNVQSGDTVSGIAKKNRIPFSRIKEMNPNIKNFDKIRVGQPIRIAQNAPVAQPPTV